MPITIDLINKYNINPIKKLGQNFLVDDNIINKIISFANIDSNDNVIEIGPGLGAISIKLIENAKKVVAYEIDQKMVQILKQEIQKENFEVQNIDFLKANFDWIGTKVVIGNIPYYITSKIIFKILKNHFKFNKVILMIQKDVAEKFCASPNSKKYTKSTVAINYFGGMTKAFDISQNSFYPIPKISSSVVSINISKKLSTKNEDEFLKFLKIAFFARRKTLINNLKREYDNLLLIDTFNKLNFDLNIRAQQLNVDEYIKLWESLNV